MFSPTNIHFCFQTYRIAGCKVSAIFNNFVNSAIVELGSTVHSEYKINFIFRYFRHNLYIFLKGCDSVTFLSDRIEEKCDKRIGMVVLVLSNVVTSHHSKLSLRHIEECM